jgi:hypothetical protein
MNDDKATRHGRVAIIGFNVMVILCMIVYSWLRGGISELHFIDFIVTIVLSTGVGAGAFKVANILDL